MVMGPGGWSFMHVHHRSHGKWAYPGNDLVAEEPESLVHDCEDDLLSYGNRESVLSFRGPRDQPTRRIGSQMQNKADDQKSKGAVSHSSIGSYTDLEISRDDPGVLLRAICPSLQAPLVGPEHGDKAGGDGIGARMRNIRALGTRLVD
ncbi:hypothetical protein N7461_001371 [Penicillium sp. DV-2018c]|nr:hypothetical protein N7461_001371 [Penicillium sp. DV-2018c]